MSGLEQHTARGLKLIAAAQPTREGSMNEPTPGDWRPGKTADSVVSDTLPTDPQQLMGWDQKAWDYYNGFLIAESIGNPADVLLIAAAKETAALVEDLREACRLALPCIDTRLFRQIGHMTNDPELIAVKALEEAIAKSEPTNEGTDIQGSPRQSLTRKDR